MRRDDSESVEIWASRPDVWDQEPQQVKIKWGAAVEAARKRMAKPKVAPKLAKSDKKK
tara:strand:- start:229 stop:402 length:174 start_codon:yes stop_codon:yes gene_type:complete